MELKKEWYSIGEAGKILGVSLDTLRRWEKKGHIHSFRTAGNRRRYSKNVLVDFLINHRTGAKRFVSNKQSRKINKGSQKSKKYNFIHQKMLILNFTLLTFTIILLLFVLVLLWKIAQRPVLSPICE